MTSDQIRERINVNTGLTDWDEILEKGLADWDKEQLTLLDVDLVEVLFKLQLIPPTSSYDPVIVVDVFKFCPLPQFLNSKYAT